MLASYTMIISDSPAKAVIVDSFLESQLRRTQQTKSYKERLQYIVEAQQLLLVIDKTYNPGKLKNRALDAGSILAQLTPHERSIVEAGVKNMISTWEAQVGNNCPHVKLVHTMYTAKTTKARLAAFNQLKEYITKISQKCVNCGFQVMCPHYYTYMTLLQEYASPSKIRSELVKYVKSQNDSQYFCKLCGGMLGDIMEEDRTGELIGQYGEMGTEQRAIMWYQALAALENLVTPARVVIDKKLLAGKMVNTVLPVILQYEEHQKEVEANQRQLLSIIGIYAYLLGLIAIDPTLGFANIGPKAKSGVYADAMVKIIMTTHANMIRQIPIANEEYIVTHLRSMFKLIGRTISGEPVPTPKDILVLLTSYDPIYKFAAYIARLYNPTLLPEDLFSTVIGYSLKALMAKHGGNEVDTSKIEFRYKRPEVNFYNNLYKLPIKIPVDLLSRYYQLFRQYVVDIYTAEQLKQYQAHFAKFREDDVPHVITFLQHIFDFKSSTYISIAPAPYGHLYDEQGVQHVWTIYLVGNERQEVQIHQLLADRSLYGKVVDMKCEVCGIYQSETSKLNEETIKKAIATRSILQVLFEFYNTRCPEGEMHNFVDNHCTKCGIKYQTLYNFSDAENMHEALDYYNKYISKLQEEKTLTETYERPKVADVEPSDEYAQRAKAWTRNFDNIVKAAELIETSAQLFEAIGKTEGRNYSEVLEGRTTASLEHITSNIAMSADAEARLFITDYLSLINYKNTFRPQQRLSDIVNTVLQHEYDVLATLPPLDPDYDPMFRACLKLSATKAFNYVVEFICRSALMIASVKSPIGLAFVKSELTLILRNQRLMAKPESQGFQLGVDVADDAIAETRDAGEIDDEELAIIASKEESLDMYSGMDYSGINDGNS